MTTNITNTTYIRYDQGVDVFGTRCQTLLIACSADGQIPPNSALERVFDRHPNWQERYQRACLDGELHIGQCLPLRNKYGRVKVVLIALRERNRDFSSMSALARGLAALADNYEQLDITSIATVKLGCSRSPHALAWSEVGMALFTTFEAMGIPAEIYIGRNDPEIYPRTARAERPSLPVVTVAVPVPPAAPIVDADAEPTKHGFFSRLRSVRRLFSR